MKKQLFFSALLVLCIQLQSQNFPWNNALMIARSTDGITFNTPAVFQDSAGVPSVIRWKGDTLIAVFQWFRLPNPSPSWDRVAVKMSYDNGNNWTNPMPINFTGMPSNFQRPFDPALAKITGDSLRMYFSSSAMPLMMLDSTVNTYSAKSADGINFSFENGARVDVSSGPVIDPSVIYFNNGWHYAAPAGAPQQGAFHYLSPDGKNFSPVSMITSDNLHNWTGNYMIENPSELRFYGSGQLIWFNSSPNGGVWNGYVSTNLQGGDPSCLKTGVSSYIIVYVGMPFATDLRTENKDNYFVSLFPNPAYDNVQLKNNSPEKYSEYFIFDANGSICMQGTFAGTKQILVDSLPVGVYFIKIKGTSQVLKFVKL